MLHSSYEKRSYGGSWELEETQFLALFLALILATSLLILSQIAFYMIDL